MPVNDAIAGPTDRSRHVSSASVPGIGYRVILPNRVSLASRVCIGVASRHVYLSIVIAGGHLMARPGHGGSGTPTISSNVIDARSVVYRSSVSVHPTKHEELVHIRCVHEPGQRRSHRYLRDEPPSHTAVGRAVEGRQVPVQGQAVSACRVNVRAVALRS
jgi:hypothetical protein